MQYYRCKCGKSWSWSSQGVPECRQCSECGSDLAPTADCHEEPKEHSYVTQYDVKTGATYEICLNCLQRKEDVK